MIEISTPQQLHDIRNDLTAEYILVNDIDLSSWGSWEPIDDFEGGFYGGGYTIYGLKLDTTYYSYSLGLFRYAYNAYFADVTIDGGEAIIEQGGYTVSLLVANAGNLSTIDNCHIKNSYIRSKDFSGPLSGDVNNSLVKNCSAKNILIELSGSGYGYANGGLYGSDGAETLNCYAEDITFRQHADSAENLEFESSGGLMAGGGPYTYRCHTKNITMEFDLYDYVGGLVGIKSNATFEECWVENVNIKATGSGGNTVGGFAGYLSSQAINCYATGVIDGVQNILGGFAGSLDNRNDNTEEFLLKNCYSAVEILNYGANPGDNDVGGFNGYFDTYNQYDYILKDCYFDSQLADGLDSYGGFRSTGDEVYIISEALPRSTEEMTYEPASNTYLNWNFSGVWYIYPVEIANNGYPVLYEVEFTAEPEKIYFITPPTIKVGKMKANVVTVKSPSAEFTAIKNNISKDDYIERVVEIDEGDFSVCRTVAEQLLLVWGREPKSLTGEIALRQNLHFKEKVVIIIPDDNFEERMQLQKISHSVISQRTKIVCGDIILSDNELLSRIIADI